jgi:hypothetical protein
MEQMPKKFEINTNLLVAEYIDWVTKYNTERSHTDLRFGQYLCNNYLITGQAAPEVFYEEDPAKVYLLVFNDILQYS